MGGEEKILLRDILDRLKEAAGVTNDVDLVEPLMTNKRNISAWKERNSIPWETLLTYCRKQRVSLEWLINGHGPVFVSDMVVETGAIYRVETNQDAIYALSSNVYRALQESGKEITPEKFADIVRLLHRDMLEGKANEVSYEKVLGVVKLATIG